MRRRSLAALAAPLALAAAACQPNVLVGAGDIASCDWTADTDTAELVDDLPGEVVTMGDNVYEEASAADFAECYDPTWGRHNGRVHPVPGNHEYLTTGAAGYFGYFGERAGPAGLGYYYFDKGGWRIFALNSEDNVTDAAQFVRDHAAGRRCIAAVWHRPYKGSGIGGPGTDTSVAPLWQAVYDVGGDLVLNGHQHDYERFAPLDRTGAVAAGGRGVREIVVGTGGVALRPFGTVQAGSEVRHSASHGVLSVELRDAAYVWRFHPTSGTFTDSGYGPC